MSAIWNYVYCECERKLPIVMTGYDNGKSGGRSSRVQIDEDMGNNHQRQPWIWTRNREDIG